MGMSGADWVRARDLDLPFEGTPGANNAITDVDGVEVGHTTLISGEGPLVVGQGPVRTGVTAILPRGRADSTPCYAGWFSLNGNGEMTGTAWIDESGLLESPILITNTHSVGVTRDAAIAWMRSKSQGNAWCLPVVAETYDGALNDIDGFHIKPSHVFEALDSARSGPVSEGNVGGGTGMICYGYKGGIGTASRIVGDHTVGALVQANHGRRSQLRALNVMVGHDAAASSLPDRGSIIIVLATDAPMLPHQLKALAKRASLGLARTGAVASISSGDLFIAFSTGNDLAGVNENHAVMGLGHRHISTVFEAAVQAVEEAILNSLVAAKTMSGIDGFTVEALPHELLRHK